MRQSSSLNWPVLLFVTLSPLVAVGGTIGWIASGRFNAATLLLAGAMAIFTGLAITAGYHRLFAHRTYVAAWPLRLFFLLLGGAGIEESAWSWCRDHRRHHRYVDREGDPYNIRRGFWYAHFGWMFRKDAWRAGDAGGSDLWEDPLVRFQHRFYVPLAVLVSLILPMGIAALWGDPWGGLLIAGFGRIVVNQHLTFAINSVAHTFGKQPYSDRHSARDNWATALFTYGEGYHNFHHEFAGDYRNGLKPYHWDPTKWLIHLLWKVGLASDLRTADPEAIAYRQIHMQEKLLMRRLQGTSGTVADPSGPGRLASARERVGAAAARVRALNRQGRMRGATPARQPALDTQLRQARLEFERAVSTWRDAARSFRTGAAV